MVSGHKVIGINRLLFALILFAIPACGGDSGEPSDAASAECATCHGVQADAWENFSSHRALYGCAFCHEEADSTPGTGHRASPGCDRCHSEQGHPPKGILFPRDGRLDTCPSCHDPHGSKNIYLIRESLSAGFGKTVCIDFRNVEGRADYSFAELGAEEGGENGREPGSGLCEVCHRWTKFYDRYATGEDHFTDRCSGCHDHAVGFEVKQPLP